MNTIDLATIVAGSVVLCWRYPALRALALMLCMGVAVLPFTNTLAIPDRAFVYVPLDVAGGIAGFMIWMRFKEKAGRVFLVSSLLACCLHLAMFWTEHTRTTNNLYIGLLNAVFILTCLIIGGTGLARSHRHLFERDRAFHSQSSLGHRG